MTDKIGKHFFLKKNTFSHSNKKTFQHKLFTVQLQAHNNLHSEIKNSKLKNRISKFVRFTWARRASIAGRRSRATKKRTYSHRIKLLLSRIGIRCNVPYDGTSVRWQCKYAKASSDQGVCTLFDSLNSITMFKLLVLFTSYLIHFLEMKESIQVVEQQSLEVLKSDITLLFQCTLVSQPVLLLEKVKNAVTF